ncbi:MAG: hypothetical protein JHC95_21620, partial [Solirubrobacteraceae bacterium]|nr:hypothetical protein [Solirubrobacteraceae bacterium]
MTSRLTRSRAALALLLLPVAIPIAALATDEDPAAPGLPGAKVVVAEQVSMARDVVPFAIATDGAARTVWATGRTRTTSTLSGRRVVPPPAGAPASTVLVEGAIAGDERATAWRRAAPPLDAAGNPLPTGAWRVDDGGTSPTSDPTSAGDALHAGAGTPAGAAALLVRIRDGAGVRPAVLARTSDGRFRELPAPPGANPFAAPAGAVTPMAVVDVPVDAATPDRGRTGLLLAPAGRDGVLRWDGAAWTEEPWEDEDGDPLGARTAVALDATPAGDVVALFAGDPTAADADRVLLARRDDAEAAFRPAAVDASRLLKGQIPSGVREIRPVAAPGQPLTIAPGHWWVDLVVTRDDGAAVSTTVHLKPEATAPAQATGTWCSAALPADATCDRTLGFRFATTRGYRSQAFAEDDPAWPYGQRAITSPVIPEATGSPAAQEASASGGYLALVKDRFDLRSGAGDDGAAGTQAGAFAVNGFVVIGGVRTIARTMPSRSAAFGRFDASTRGTLDSVADIDLSPPGTPPEQQGAIEMSWAGNFQRRQGTDTWGTATMSEGVADGGSFTDTIVLMTAFAWDTPTTAIVAGRGGMLMEVPVPRVAMGFTVQASEPTRTIDVAQGLDLLDVAARDGDAWAVGRSGAILHRRDRAWSRVALPPAFASAHLVRVAYAGEQALIASDHGLLVAGPDGSVAPDDDLADLMRTDGRPVGVSSVAGLSDGAAVVDARYVRLRAGEPWRRLASPAEGDVVALALWRDATGGAELESSGGAPTASGLQIAASLADTGRPVFGEDQEFNFGDPDEDEDEDEDGRLQFEGAADPRDGRLAVLSRDGWTDAMGVPLTRSVGRDLGAWSPPVHAIAVDEQGNGWAAGGTGSLFDVITGSVPSYPASFEMALGQPVSDTNPPDVREPPFITPPSAPLRIFVGGHAACLDECAGRGDQAVAPDASLREALATAARVGRPEDAPTVMVVGGGRSSAGGAPLTPAGARRYADLLGSSPQVTVAAAIGTADARTPESRAAFRSALADFFPGRATGPRAVVPVTNPPAPIDVPGSDTIAYAFDVPHRDNPTAARVVVIDNAGGPLRGGADGDQAIWMSAVLKEAAEKGIPSIVVGAVQLEGGPAAGNDLAPQLALLAAGRVSAYVSTDGIDDVDDPAYGPRTETKTVGVPGQEFALHHTSGLGHAAPLLAALRPENRERTSETERLGGWPGPALLGIDVERSTTRGVTVPLYDHFADRVIYADRGRADFVGVPGTTGAGAGFMWTDPATPGAVPVEARANPATDLTMLMCSIYLGRDECPGMLPLDATFRVADPSTAVFVRAKPRKRETSEPPAILLDGQGNPVSDETSPVLCPLRAGQTTVAITVSGRTATFPLRVTEPPAEFAPRGGAPCSFVFGEPPRSQEPPPNPAPQKIPQPTPAPTPDTPS